MSSRRTLFSIMTVSAVAVLAVVGFGLWPRLAKQRTMLADAKEESNRLPSVRVARVAVTTGSSELELPADLQAEIRRRIYGWIPPRVFRQEVIPAGSW